MDRRDSARIPTRIEALVSCDGEERAATLADISYSGARIEDCSEPPPVGSRVRVYVFPPAGRAFELEGVVGRHAPAGFALQYELHDAMLRRRVDAVVAHLKPAATG